MSCPLRTEREDCRRVPSVSEGVSCNAVLDAIEDALDTQSTGPGSVWVPVYASSFTPHACLGISLHATFGHAFTSSMWCTPGRTSGSSLDVMYT